MHFPQPVGKKTQTLLQGDDQGARMGNSAVRIKVSRASYYSVGAAGLEAEVCWMIKEKLLN